MKRLPGIIISAIVLLLGSLFQLLLGVGMGAVGVAEKIQILNGNHPPTVGPAGPAAALPAWMPIFMYVLAGFCAVLAAWGIITAIGLFRMYRWARYSVLVIGGCLAFFCLPAMLFSLALLFIPLPMPATVDPSQLNTVHSLTKIIFGVVSAIYGVVGGVGVFWLVYFNLKKVRAAFASVPLAGDIDALMQSPRPFLISVIAVMDIIGVVTMAVLAFLPFPATFLIWILQGWHKAVFALLYGALFAAAAYGLWNLKEWGRQLAIALQVVGLMQYITFLVHPYVFANYNAQIQTMMKLPQQMQDPLFYNQKMINFSMVFGMVFLIAILVVLHYYRGKFRAPAEPTHTATPALPSA
jgi:hypothetical protein